MNPFWHANDVDEEYQDLASLILACLVLVIAVYRWISLKGRGSTQLIDQDGEMYQPLAEDTSHNSSGFSSAFSLAQLFASFSLLVRSTHARFGTLVILW